MTAARRPWWHVDRSLLVLLGIVAVTGVVQLLVFRQRAFLNVYYLPVVLGAYLLGKRRGVLAALLSWALVMAITVYDRRHFWADPDHWARLADLLTWGGFLVLTAWLVGKLYELKESRLADLHDAYRGVLEIMGKFIDSVDRHTENHSRRVAALAVGIATEMGLGTVEADDIRVGAYLHDVGKIEVSARVLRKAAALTPEEHREMRSHVEKGERLVSHVGGILRHVVPMIAYHHERWDGSGYRGLRGEEIPIGARIIAVADAYDAMVSDRPYRTGMSTADALAEVLAQSGRQFDPAVVAAFGRVQASRMPASLERAA